MILPYIWLSYLYYIIYILYIMIYIYVIYIYDIYNIIYGVYIYMVFIYGIYICKNMICWSLSWGLRRVLHRVFWVVEVEQIPRCSTEKSWTSMLEPQRRGDANCWATDPSTCSTCSTPEAVKDKAIRKRRFEDTGEPRMLRMGIDVMWSCGWVEKEKNECLRTYWILWFWSTWSMKSDPFCRNQTRAYLVSLSACIGREDSRIIGSVEFDRMICLKFLIGMYQDGLVQINLEILELVSVGFPNLGTHLNHPSLEARCDIRCEAKESVPLSDSSNRSWPRHADLSIFFIISIA